jgi:PAS domain S-box-containing protein
MVYLLLAVVFFFETIGLFEGINNYCYDLAFRLRGERPHNDRIVIAAIDEKTLEKLGKWPLPRSRYAQLLNSLNQAAAVGINIIFSESSDDDTRLSLAMGQHGKVVLPVYIDSRLNISYPVKEFSSVRIGHAHLEQGIDGVVRTIFHKISCQYVTLPSFVSTLHDILGNTQANKPVIAAPVVTHKMYAPIQQSKHMRINFYGAPGAFQYFSVSDILGGRWHPSFFSDKIVLIGKTAIGLEEGVLVPFSQDRCRMPAVEVHAHMLNNLLDRGHIQPIERWIRWIAVIVSATFCSFLFIRFESFKATLLLMLSLLTLSIVVYYLFTGFNLWPNPAGWYVSLSVVFILAYVHKLKRMKLLLLQAKEDWEESFNTIDDAIIIYDKNCNIVRANKAAEDTFGSKFMESLKRRCFKLCYGNEASASTKKMLEISTNEDGVTEDKYEAELGKHIETRTLPRFDEHNRIVGMVQVMRDVTEKKKSEKEHQMLQERLTQAQKMEAIGSLAGGITHDFNNILAAVMGYTELALLDTPDDSLVGDKLKQALKACQRARKLVEQILVFSRQAKEKLQPKPIQFRLIIEEDLKFLRSTLPSTIQIRQDIASNGVVVADPIQLHQIIMNLCTNANHAMQERGGVLEVNLTEVNIDSTTLSGDANTNLLPGPYIKLTVSDTGHGMAPDTINRIFEPYFTTKAKGVGTGLGLAMVHGIVSNLDGTIEVKSDVGEGTTFHVYLPRAESISEAISPVETDYLPIGSEQIMLVDDDLELLNISEAMLMQLGYEVISKNKSRDALDEFRRIPDHFDLILTDMTMPEMTGEKLAQEVIRIRPDIPVVLCTGYSENIDAQKAKEIGIKAFVMKPLTLRNLAVTIRQVLDKRE